MCALVAPRAETGPIAGSRIGNYELIRQIGRGGMGLVFLARDLKLARRVAIKFLRSDADPTLARRFVVEARTTARCVHENIVVIHEVAAWNGLPYMVLEYLEGTALSKVMAEGPLPLSRALSVMTAVAKALACAHDAGIIHRDLKPENIFVTHRGVVKVLDFGIAALLHATDEATQRDMATMAQVDGGRIFGTAPYMAPEQWTGEEIDARADLFAFGVILYRALVGAHPAGTTARQEVEAATRSPAPFRSIALASPTIPEALAAVVDRCLRKRRDERFASASELARALEPHRARAATHHDDDECPYPGLANFTARDAERYFGRSSDLQHALETLRAKPLLAVLGQSGAGKSSFVHAGIVAALAAERERWHCVALRPGARPLTSLELALAELPGAAPPRAASALRSTPGALGQWLRAWCHEHDAHIVLVIDQAEELFSLCRDPAEREGFLSCLLGAADDVAAPLRVILTLRSDFLQELATTPEASEAIVSGAQLLAPLDRANLREALEGPLELSGYRFADAAVIDELVDSFSGSPHALPMLQAVAMQLWSHRDRASRTIPSRAIDAIGGVAGAIARYADNVVAALPRGGLELAAVLLPRLVTARDTRAVAPRVELERLGPSAPFVLRSLLEARLLVEHEADATVELTHEVLIAGWPRLAEWLSASRAERALRERVEHAAAAWLAHGRAQELLWDGHVLASVEELAARDALPADAAEFLAAAARRRDKKRRRKRIVVASAGFVLAAAATVSSLGVAVYRNAERAASEQAERATREAARSSAAERALAEKVRALEETEARRARAAAEAKAQEQAVAAQREVIERGEAELRAALTEARGLLAERDASLRAAERLRAELERSLARERASLAKERERAEALAKKQSRIFGDIP